MSARRYIVPLIAIGVAIGFAFGMVRLFQLRFKAGDIYPAYSTLRTDPLGCKAFYQALSELRGPSVSRNYFPFRKLSANGKTTLFHLGGPPLWVSSGICYNCSTRPASGPTTRPATSDEEALERFVTSGGRLVVSLVPQQGLWGSHWLGVEIEEESKHLRYKGSGLVARRNFEGTGEDTLPWHSTLYFEKLSPAWRKVYLRDDKPVIIERDLGEGTIVVCTDSYLFSNEAMRNDRYPALLAWLVGEPKEVLFDETHLGVMRKGGVATLAREYDLAGLFFVVVLLGGLFVWKNSMSFLPRHDLHTAYTNGEVVSGKSSSGLFNLLRQSIRRRKVLGVCFREWKRSVPKNRPGLSKTCSRIEAIVEDENKRSRKERNPVLRYRAICRILLERKRQHGI